MFQVNQKHFARAVKLASGSRGVGHVPILAAAQITADPRSGVATLQTTNLNTTAIVQLPMVTKEADSQMACFLPNAAATVSACGAAGGSDIVFAPKSNGTDIYTASMLRSERHNFAEDDWPGNAVVIGHERFTATLPVEIIADIQRVASAVSTEDTRYYLNGIYFHQLDEWTYRIVATDGHRLMLADIRLPNAQGQLVPTILPNQFLQSIIRHLARADEPLRLAIGPRTLPNHINSTAPENEGLRCASLRGKLGDLTATFLTKEIDGTYPDYERVIPKYSEFHAILPIGKLRQAIQAVSAGAPRNHSPCIKLTIGAGEDASVSLNYGIEGVTASMDIPCQTDCKSPFSIGFRANYMVDILNAMRGTDVRVAFQDAAAPTTWRDIGDDRFLAVLMPMRLND